MKKDWENNLAIALNHLYAKKEKIDHAYISKHNIIPLMILNGKGWHYYAGKKLSALLRGITSKINGAFFGLNCFNLSTTKNKLDSHKKVCKNKDFCDVAMHSQDTKILEFSQYQKSDKTTFIILKDLEFLIKESMDVKINPKNYLQKK